MKIGKVFAKLAMDKRVADLVINSDNQAGHVILSNDYYDSKNPRSRRGAFTNARQAEAYIKGAVKMPVAREGYEIVTNLMSGKPVEQAIGTPYACRVDNEAYWCN